MLGARGMRVARTGRRLLTIAASGNEAAALAALPGVAGVEHFVLRVKHNEFGGGVILGSQLANANGFDGSSQTVAVADTGLGTGTAAGAHADIPAARVRSHLQLARHARFLLRDDRQRRRGRRGLGPRHARRDGRARRRQCGRRRPRHRAGRRVGVPGHRELRRPVAPLQPPLRHARGYYLVGLPGDLQELFQQAYDAGARIHSDSWGSGGRGRYTADSGEHRRLRVGPPRHGHHCSPRQHRRRSRRRRPGRSRARSTRRRPRRTSSPSARARTIASRTGTCDPSLAYTTCAAQGGQNTIFTYGAPWPDSFPVNPLRDDPSAGNAEQMAAFSSRGPTTDGRIKPDVVAPGTWTLSGYSDRFQQQYDASPNPQNGMYQYDGWGFPFDAAYKYMGGTSMATPLVAGGAAVVRDFYQKTHGHQASAALVKATLINSAVDLLDENNDGVLDNAHPIPNLHEGWGRVDLANATDSSHQFSDESRAACAPARRATFTFRDRPTPAGPSRSTLVWTDYPSSPSAAVNLVNDLDLTSWRPTARPIAATCSPADGRRPAARPTAEQRRERLRASRPPGTWTVIGRRLQRADGPQPFALVMDNAPTDNGPAHGARVGRRCDARPKPDPPAARFASCAPATTAWPAHGATMRSTGTAMPGRRLRRAPGPGDDPRGFGSRDRRRACARR